LSPWIWTFGSEMAKVSLAIGYRSKMLKKSKEGKFHMKRSKIYVKVRAKQIFTASIL
jgi:hypothetical protein